MSLADLAQRSGGVPHKKCGTCHALDTLAADQRALLIAALESDIQYREIWQELNDEGLTFEVDYDSIRHHARGRRGPCRERGGQRVA